MKRESPPRDHHRVVFGFTVARGCQTPTFGCQMVAQIEVIEFTKAVRCSLFLFKNQSLAQGAKFEQMFTQLSKPEV